MSMISWAEQQTKALSIWDIGVLKIYCVLFGMIVGAYLSSFVQHHVWWFVGGVILFGFGVGYRWFTVKPAQ